MKSLKSICSEVNVLESILAQEIEGLAEHLELPPDDRDQAGLDDAFAAVNSTRRKCAKTIKDGLRVLEDAPLDDPITARKLRKTRKDLKSAQARLRLWGRYEAVVSAQILSEPQDLVAVDVPNWREVEVMDHVVSLSLDAIHKIANPTAYTQDEAANALGCHRDIPLPMGRFSKMIGAAHRLCLAQRKGGPTRFLDVGSGGGSKVLAATTCFDHCVGLEYEQSTVETGQAFLNLLAPDTCELIHTNALTYSDYGDFDVIYFYRPLVGFELMVEMEARIISQVKAGTILLVAGGLFIEDYEALGVHQLVDQVYVTGMTRDEAEDLHDKAKRMGHMVPGFRRKPLIRLAYWKPLFDVSARNGYHL